MKPAPGWGQRKPPSVVPVGALTLWSQWLLQTLVIQMPRLGAISLSCSPDSCPWATVLAPQVSVSGMGTQIVLGWWALRIVRGQRWKQYPIPQSLSQLGVPAMVEGGVSWRVSVPWAPLGMQRLRQAQEGASSSYDSWQGPVPRCSPGALLQPWCPAPG